MVRTYLSLASIPLVLLGLIVLAGSPRAPVAVAAASQSACAQQQATVAQLVGAERGAELQGQGEGLPVDEIIAMLRACWQEYQQQMPAAEKNCALFKQLNPLVLGWSRQVQLLGLEGDFASEQAQVIPWAVRGLANCYNEAFDTCVDQNDPTQAAEMVAIERQLNLLGALDQIDRTKLDRCLRFELVFTSTIDRNGLTGVTHTHSLVRATIPLRLTGEFTLAGEAPLDYVEFTMRWPDGDSCTVAVNSFRGSTAVVSSFRYELRQRPDGDREITGFEMTFDPGTTTESVTARCDQAVNNHTEPYYSGYFRLLHADERTADGYLIRDWTRTDGGPVLARKTYSRTVTPEESPLPHTEVTTFELRHTPVR